MPKAIVDSTTSYYTMDLLQRRYYKINKILTTIIGQWPYQSIRSSRGFLAIVIFLCSSQTVPLTMATVKYHGDWDIFLDALSGLLFAAAGLIKLANFLCNAHKMTKLLNRVFTDWLLWSQDREINILHEYAERGRKFTILYTVTMYSIGTLFVIQPIVPKLIDVLLHNSSEPGKFPIPVYYHYLDVQEYYFYVTMHIYVSVSALATILISYDIMLIVYVHHGCGIFAAVGHKLQRIGKNEIREETEKARYSANQIDMTLEIVACILRHNDAIEYANLIESTYTWTFGATLLLRVALMSVIGLQVFTKLNDYQEIARFLGTAVAQMLYVYVESYIAQILLDHSTSIRSYVHNGQWYGLSLKTQKLLQFMSMRCNVPCQLTAAKVYNISVESFAKFLKTSMSYLTVLRSI